MILRVLQDQLCFSFLFSRGAGKIAVFVQRGILQKPIKSSECCYAENIVICKRRALQKITALDYNGLWNVFDDVCSTLHCPLHSLVTVFSHFFCIVLLHCVALCLTRVFWTFCIVFCSWPEKSVALKDEVILRALKQFVRAGVGRETEKKTQLGRLIQFRDLLIVVQRFNQLSERVRATKAAQTGEQIQQSRQKIKSPKRSGWGLKLAGEVKQESGCRVEKAKAWVTSQL